MFSFTSFKDGATYPNFRNYRALTLEEANQIALQVHGEGYGVIVWDGEFEYSPGTDGNLQKHPTPGRGNAPSISIWRTCTHCGQEVPVKVYTGALERLRKGELALLCTNCGKTFRPPAEQSMSA